MQMAWPHRLLCLAYILSLIIFASAEEKNAEPGTKMSFGAREVPAGAFHSVGRVVDDQMGSEPLTRRLFDIGDTMMRRATMHRVLGCRRTMQVGRSG
jgi:hypothetical protein